MKLHSKSPKNEERCNDFFDAHAKKFWKNACQDFFERPPNGYWFSFPLVSMTAFTWSKVSCYEAYPNWYNCWDIRMCRNLNNQCTWAGIFQTELSQKSTSPSYANLHGVFGGTSTPNIFHFIIMGHFASEGSWNQLLVLRVSQIVPALHKTTKLKANYLAKQSTFK